MRFLLILLALCNAAFAARSEGEKLIASPYVFALEIKERIAGSGQRDRFKVAIKMVIKGEYSRDDAVLAVYRPGELPALLKGKTYLAYCYDAISNRELVFFADQDECTEVNNLSLKPNAERIRLMSLAQQEIILERLRSDPNSGSAQSLEFDALISELFERKMRLDTLRRFMSLPDEKITQLVSRVYDTRPISPRRVFYTLRDTESSSDPHASCVCVQDFLFGLFSVRLSRTFGEPSENLSLARRTAMADAWYYSVVCEGKL